MANNEYINKVEYGDLTLMDITDTTVESGDVIEGQVFYAKSGARSVGTLGDATINTHGLMSAEDKSKLDGITSGAAVTDVLINSSSILSNGVANVSYANKLKAGVVKVTGVGIDIYGPEHGSVEGSLYLITANSEQIKAGNNTMPVNSAKQHEAVFYGLSKVAGVDLANENVTIGIYPETSKAAIRSILGAGTYSKPSTGIPASDLASGVIPNTSIYAPKANPIFTGSISMGRKSETTVGTNSIAIGNNVEASGFFSYAEGGRTKATAAGSHASGGLTVASGLYSYACGFNTVTNSGSQYVIGQYNFIDILIPSWAANTHYYVGDKIKRDSIIGDEGYICILENTDSNFDMNKWQSSVLTSNNVFVVGNGLTEDTRSNAYVITWDGDGKYAGDVYVNCNADSSGGTKVATIEDVESVKIEVIRL